MLPRNTHTNRLTLYAHAPHTDSHCTHTHHTQTHIVLGLHKEVSPFTWFSVTKEEVKASQEVSKLQEKSQSCPLLDFAPTITTRSVTSPSTTGPFACPEGLTINPKMTVEKNAPRKPSHVLLGESLIRLVRPKKKPKRTNTKNLAGLVYEFSLYSGLPLIQPPFWSSLLQGWGLISGVDFDYRVCFGTFQSVINTGVASLRESRLERLHCSRNEN